MGVKEASEVVQIPSDSNPQESWDLRETNDLNYKRKLEGREREMLNS